MIIQCPACGRPNAPEQIKCLYCGQELKAQSKHQSSEKASPQKQEETETKPRLFLILPPQIQEPSKQAIEGFARIMKWDLYTSKIRLKNPAPLILKVFENSQEAHTFCNQINQLGIDAYLLKESGLQQMKEKLIAVSAEQKEDRLIFQTEQGETRELKNTELFLLVRGRARLEGELSTKLGKSFIPEIKPERQKIFDRLIQRRQEKKMIRQYPGSLIRTDATEVELFDLYVRDNHRALRVIETRFDFSSLFGPDFKGGLLGLARLVELLKSKNPDLIINDNFNQVGYTYREKPVEKNILLLPPESKKKASEKLHNSYAFFTEYSGIIYLHYLKKFIASETDGKK